MPGLRFTPSVELLLVSWKEAVIITTLVKTPIRTSRLPDHTSLMGYLIGEFSNNFIPIADMSHLIQSSFRVTSTLFISLWMVLASPGEGVSQPSPEMEAYVLDNPVNVDYLTQHLRKDKPRLIMTQEAVQQLRAKLESDPVVKNVYEAIKLNAREIQEQPLLERNLIGRRLLATSREMLYRMNVLGVVYIVDREPAVLERINEELLAVIDFEDWNPSHYLDVAEMSMAVAFALDWVGSELPQTTVERAKEALINKGLKPSFEREGSTWWINGNNNWNQVCHGGMIAAAITVAEDEPELAAETISRALQGMPYALKEYGPHGVYPEGPTYWGYGTSFSVLTASMLESAFGTDFGLTAVPGFMESADFYLMSIAPSGWYFNFADAGDQRGESGNLTLAWFAAKTGNRTYFEKDRFMGDPEEIRELGRHAGAGLVWLAQFEDSEEKSLPLAWKGDGDNPVVFFRGGNDDNRQYFFGGKGGRGSVNHGNMDAGSFVFELDGVRWAVDPGNQSYHDLEKVGFDLWGSCQQCERWTLLTKNNYGHSTLTVNDSLHRVDGFAPITRFDDGDIPKVSIDLTEVFEGQLAGAHRTFTRENGHSLLIEDDITLSEATKTVTWQMMTTAEVIPTETGAILRQDSKELNLEVLSPSGVRASVISLDPPPLELDRRIENLKRVEIRIPAWHFQGSEGEIRVRLSGSDS